MLSTEPTRAIVYSNMMYVSKGCESESKGDQLTVESGILNGENYSISAFLTGWYNLNSAGSCYIVAKHMVSQVLRKESRRNI